MTKLIDEATAPVDGKINEMQMAVLAQKQVLNKVEEGFIARYELYVSKLKDKGVAVSWNTHKKDSFVKITKGHDALIKVTGELVDSASNMAGNLIGGIEGDGTDLKGSVKSTFNDIKDDLQDAMQIFLGSQVGIEKNLSKNQILVQGNNIRIIYVQAYNTTLEASGLDGEKKISCYAYLTNTALVNIFKSDPTEIITMLGNSVEGIDEFKMVLEAEKLLLLASGDGTNSALAVPAAVVEDKDNVTFTLEPDSKRIKPSLDPEAEEKLKKIDAITNALNV